MRYIIALFVVMLALPALAQEPTTIINAGDLLAPWLETLTGAVMIVITALLGWVATQIQRRTGITIEASHRDALQTALMNAAGRLLAKLETSVSDMRFDVRNPLIAEAIVYVNKSAPGAIDYFGLGADDLVEKLVAKLGIATAPALPPTK